MTEAARLFKQQAAQCQKQAVYFRRHFNGLALGNLLGAAWMAAAGVFIGLEAHMPARLMALVLFVLSGLALNLARQTRAQGQQAFQDFMRLRSNSLAFAAEIEGR